MSLEDSLRENRNNIKDLIDEIELREERLKEEIEEAIINVNILGYKKESELIGAYCDSKNYENSLAVINDLLER